MDDIKGGASDVMNSIKGGASAIACEIHSFELETILGVSIFFNA